MRLRVEFFVEVPDSTNIDQAQEWLNFELCKNTQIQATNPFFNKQLEASSVELELY